jgi:hypothetical protein
MNRARLIATLVGALLAVIITQSGCVLPGGLRAVGGQAVDGRLVNAQGQGVPNAEIILLQGHFDRLDAKTAAYLDRAEDVYEVERSGVMTDSQGHFSHKFKGFTHCHPTWILPPLLTLPSKISGETRHGTFFVIQTPAPNGQIYEVTVGKPQPSVLLFDPERGRRTEPAKSQSTEKVNVRSEVIPWIYSTGYTGQVERVFLEIVRDGPLRGEPANGSHPPFAHVSQHCGLAANWNALCPPAVDPQAKRPRRERQIDQLHAQSLSIHMISHRHRIMDFGP